MTANNAPAEPAGDQATARPQTVYYALYFIAARCVLALAAAAAAFGARSEFTDSLRDDHPDWSQAKLHDTVSSQLRDNVYATIIYILIVLVIAKFVWDGRNWSRWVLALVSLVLTGDIGRVTAFFASGNIGYRFLLGLTGLACVIAIVLLFVPRSAPFFRRQDAEPRGLASLFGPKQPSARAGAGAGAVTVDSTDEAPPAGPAVELPIEEPADEPRATTAAKRSAPRAKSRRQAAE